MAYRRGSQTSGGLVVVSANERVLGAVEKDLEQKVKEAANLKRQACDILSSYTDDKTLMCLVGNCVSRDVLQGSLLHRLSALYTYANPYPERQRGPYPNLASHESRPQQGTVIIRTPPTGSNTPSFAFLFSQFRMGGVDSDYYMNAKYIDNDYCEKSLHSDDIHHRVENFKSCLTILKDAFAREDEANLNNFNRIVFLRTFEVREWKEYDEHLSAFAGDIKEINPRIEVVFASQKKQSPGGVKRFK